MNQLQDVITLFIFVPVQWRITVLWRRMARRSPAASAWIRAITALNLILGIGWLLSMIPALGGPVWNSHLALVLRTVTLGYCMIAVVALTVQTAFRWFENAIGATKFSPGRRRALRAAGNVAMAAPFAALGYGALIGRLDFRIREIDLPLAGLPDGLDGLRLLHLSDIHLSPFLSEEEFARVIDASNELRANLVVVTGDLISSHADPVDACIRQIARLKSDAGIYGCMGNHEHFARLEEYTETAAARAGIPFLRGQARTVRIGNASLNLAGVDYQPLYKKDEYLRGAEKLVTPGAFNVLLSHNPDVFPVAARQGYNFMLAGHTHGGQVSVEILDQAINPARFLTPFVYGLYRQGESAAYVTRGIGTIGIPARIGAPPEISLLRLRKA